MRGHILLSIFLVFGAAQGRRKPGGGSNGGSSAAPTGTAIPDENGTLSKWTLLKWGLFDRAKHNLEL